MTGRSSVQPQAAAGDAAPAERQMMLAGCERLAGLPPFGEWVRRIHADMKTAFARPVFVKREGI